MKNAISKKTKELKERLIKLKGTIFDLLSEAPEEEECQSNAEVDLYEELLAVVRSIDYLFTEE